MVLSKKKFFMNLQQIIRVIGKPAIDLSHEAGVSQFRLHMFLHGRGALRADEERAVLHVLLAHGEKVEAALNVLRQVGQA